MLTTLLLAAAGLYAVIVSAFAVGAAGLRRTSAAEGRLGNEHLPRAAVILPARDEEHRLSRCLDALLAQDYPSERLLVVVVDDHSTDGTAALVARYRRAVELALASSRVAATADGPELEATALAPFAGDGLPAPPGGPQVICVPAPTGGRLRGKAAALHAGIKAAGDFDPDVLLFTDADCAPPVGWCRAMASRLSEPGVGLTCGRTEVAASPKRGAPLLPAAEALDWTYLLTAAAVLTERVRPATGMGNNMGIRREVYEQIGGYHGVRFSVTEDHALFHAVTTRTRWKARFPLDPAMAVQTLPLPNLREVYGQRRRWARGGLLAGPMLFLLYALVHVGHLVPLVALGLAVAGRFPVEGVVAIILSKFTVDFALFCAALSRERRGLVRALLAEEGLLFLYFLTVPFTLIVAPRINWKGRTH